MKATGVFTNASTTLEVPAGGVVFAQGDEGDEMFGVISGDLELVVDGVAIAKLGPDDVFGEMALIDRSPRMATARAITDATLAVVDRRHFLFLVTETPMFALQVMSTMAERLRRS